MMPPLVSFPYPAGPGSTGDGRSHLLQERSVPASAAPHLSAGDPAVRRKAQQVAVVAGVGYAVLLPGEEIGDDLTAGDGPAVELFEAPGMGEPPTVLAGDGVRP